MLRMKKKRNLRERQILTEGLKRRRRKKKRLRLRNPLPHPVPKETPGKLSYILLPSCLGNRKEKDRKQS
jgi:hypothetical protein